MTETPVEEVPVEKTPDELEKEAQLEDVKKAEEEGKASDEAMKALTGPWSNVRRHRGVGPLVLETRRGAIKVFSGDIVARHTPKAPEGEEKPEDKMAREAKAEDLVFTEEQFVELSGIEAKLLPEDPFYRAIAIGEARRKAAAEPPAEEPPAGSGGSTPAPATNPPAYDPNNF